MAPHSRSNALLDDKDRLADAYRSPGSIAALADRAGVSAATVRRALVRHEIDRLPRNRNRRHQNTGVLDDAESLADLHQNHTGAEIADELGVSTTTTGVSDVVLLSPTPPPPPSGSPRLGCSPPPNQR